MVDGRTVLRRFIGVPAQPRQAIFGRDAVLAEVRAKLCRQGGSAALCALNGLPGVGKTTLALALVYDLDTLNHFRGGVLWAGLGPKADVTLALDRWGTALGVDLSTARDAGEAGILTNIGNVHSNVGDKRRALELYNEALSLRRAVGDRPGEAAALINMGHVHSDLGDKTRALELYNEALSLRRVIGDRFGEVVTLVNIAICIASRGETAEAIALLERVVQIGEPIQHPDLSSHRTILKRIRIIHRSVRFVAYLLIILVLFAAGWLVISQLGTFRRNHGTHHGDRDRAGARCCSGLEAHSRASSQGWLCRPQAYRVAICMGAPGSAQDCCHPARPRALGPVSTFPEPTPSRCTRAHHARLFCNRFIA